MSRIVLLFVGLTVALTACRRTRPERGERASAPVERRAIDTPRIPVPSKEAQTVRVATVDGVVLEGTLWAGAHERAPAVILLHQLGGSRADWAKLVELLVRPPGLTVLAVDLRGHGASTTRRDGSTIQARSMSNADFAQLPADVGTLVEFVRSHRDLQPRHLVLVGASIGSSAALVAASTNPGIAAVGALSPGRSYRGLEVLPAMARFGPRPLLVAAGLDDRDSLDAARSLERMAAYPKTEYLEGAAHGTALFEAHVALLASVDHFVRESVGQFD